MGKEDAAVGEVADAHVYAYYVQRVFVGVVIGGLGVGALRVEVAVGEMREEVGGQEGFGAAGVDAGGDGEGSELGELAFVDP